jgi:3-oxoacyl-[acyl-carrier-protein] synthase III
MKGMAMRGVVSCVPETEVCNDRDYPWFEASEVRKVTAMVGVKSRRKADDQTCTSDLCGHAAYKLLNGLGWSPGSIDGLILVTQTPDYIMPSTSCLLQHELGLSESCACFDVSLGCSAYVYGLWLANSLIASGATRRVLLLCGETPSKFVNPKDRATALLFGDAGTATALEFTEVPELIAHYIMKTDGKGAQDLIVPGGGFRDRFPEDRSKCCVSMDGGHIFDFTRSRVPEIIQEMRDFSQKDVEAYDYFIFHQANEYLIKFIAGKAGINMEKVPVFLGKFGNTGAASVPLTLSLAGAPNESRDFFEVMFLGFGVGLSWGAVSMSIPKTCLFQNLVYERMPAEV